MRVKVRVKARVGWGFMLGRGLGSLGAGDWGFVRIVSLDDDEMACHGFTFAGFAADVERVIQTNDGRPWIWYLGRLAKVCLQILTIILNECSPS